METCIYPVVRDREQVRVLLRRARAGQNQGKWVPIGNLVEEAEAARDSATAQCARLGLTNDGRLDFCGIVTETSSEDWAVILFLFKFGMRSTVALLADDAATEYRWFLLEELPGLPMPQSDSRFDYEAMLGAESFYEARMRFGAGGRLERALVP
jgi:hypothetical protein